MPRMRVHPFFHASTGGRPGHGVIPIVSLFARARRALRSNGSRRSGQFDFIDL